MRAEQGSTGKGGRWPCKGGGRDWRDAATSQGALAASGSWRGQRGSPLEALKAGCTAWPTLSFRLPAPGLVLSPLVCGPLQQPEEAHPPSSLQCADPVSHSSLLCASAPTPPPLRTPTHSFSDPQRSLLLPPSTQPRWHFQPQPTSPSPICPFYPVGGEKPCLGEHPQALLRESQVYCPTGARGGTRGKEKWDHADRSHL